MPPDDGALGRPSAVPAGRGAASSWQKRARSESRSEPSGAECGPHDEPQPAVVLVTAAGLVVGFNGFPNCVPSQQLTGGPMERA